jgi:succinoglycan biosynthesis protein ExoA
VRISIIVPCRNESKYLRAFFFSVLAQALPDGATLEMVIADGASTDGTRKILNEYAASYPWIRIVDNPRRIVSTGLNLAIELATGDIIIRMDVHADYAKDYVAQCVAVLNETKADNVGGPAQTRSTGYIQKAISAAYHSPFACGGARFHDVTYQGPVDTVTFGCWRKDVLQKIGLFDEELVRNQDDELNLRLIRAGGKIFQSPKIRCWYEPRVSLLALASQYFQYGYWKVRVIRKHGSPAALRHLVPAAFVGTLFLLSIASFFAVPAEYALAVVLGLYIFANLVASLAICSGKLQLLPVMPIVLATYHFSYGLGFLAAMLGAILPSYRSQAPPLPSN